MRRRTPVGRKNINRITKQTKIAYSQPTQLQDLTYNQTPQQMELAYDPQTSQQAYT